MNQICGVIPTLHQSEPALRDLTVHVHQMKLLPERSETAVKETEVLWIGMQAMFNKQINHCYRAYKVQWI